MYSYAIQKRINDPHSKNKKRELFKNIYIQWKLINVAPLLDKCSPHPPTPIPATTFYAMRHVASGRWQVKGGGDIKM
jgi:hypothetical protein